MRIYLSILFLLSICFVNAQIVKTKDSVAIASIDSDTVVINSGQKDSLKIFKPTIYDYLNFKQFGEKKIFDTIFTHDKTFLFSQYNNQDNFGKIQPANIGFGFNPLVLESSSSQNLALLPTHKSYLFLTADEINYYDVKTPTAIFSYHNAFRNGAALKSTYTQNIGKRFNFALEYFGLRSEGAYRNNLAANNHTLFSGWYTSKNNKYKAFAHYIHQNVNNQENGGVAQPDLFLNGDDESSNRYNMQVNLESSDSKFSARRYYFSHEFSPFNQSRFPFSLRHTIFHQGNKYYYEQGAIEDYWVPIQGMLIENFPLSTGKYSKNLSNLVSVVLNKDKLYFDAGIRYQNLTFGLREGFDAGDSFAPIEMKENRIGFVGNIKVDLWEKLKFKSFGEFSNGNEFGNYIVSKNQIGWELREGYSFSAHANFQSAYPSFNYLMNTSIYEPFNFKTDRLKNQVITDFGGEIKLKWFQTRLFANFKRIDNYTYFDKFAKTQQASDGVNYFSIGGDATFNYGKFYLNTRFQYQEVLNNEEILPLPNVIARANVYYQSKIFKNAAEIQAGIKGYYFNKFQSRSYLPIYNEYILSDTNARSIGGQPIIDLYVNMKIKKMMFFIEGQQIGTLLSHNTTEAFPNYPTYDFRLNIGFIWYMFN